MPRPGDRRPFITDHAIAVISEGGARALTHHAVDRAAGLPTGSTSYYFRTRSALVEGVVARIRERSRDAFDAATPQHSPTIESASSLIDDQLWRLVRDRRAQALTAFALLPEVSRSPELRDGLRRCLFSAELAVGLLEGLGSTAPSEDAQDLIDFLNGLAMALLFGGRDMSGRGGRTIRDSVARFLHERTRRIV
ncbi:MAG: TetR family transcriptional regulator [Microbacterium sp.]